MKTRLLFPSALAIVLSMIPFALNAQEKYVPKANEELYGTWINETASEKLITFTGGRKEYRNIADKVPTWEGTEEIVSKWTDPEGNVRYKTFLTITSENNKGWKLQELHKLSKSGAVKESVRTRVPEFDSIYFPTKIDPKSDDYVIYHRAEK